MAAETMPDYVMSVRTVRNNAFIAAVGPTKFLEVSPGQDPSPTQGISATAWYRAVRHAAVWTNAQGELRGDVLFIVHGYNTSETEVMQRHRRLRDDLVAQGFKGVVVSFDWPSDDKALAYLPDRHRAKATALQLMSDGVAYLSGQQTPDCTINVHLLGHSTGAYVIREAFDDADDSALPNSAWNVSQVVLAAGDISAASMSASDGGAEAIYHHCVRLTNYCNRHDVVLDLSNVKRVGTAPRVGRVGLPADAPAKAVNVDCTAYYEALTAPGSAIMTTDSPHGLMGVPSHSWYFGNLRFTQDLFAVVIGTDRTVIPTRHVGTDGGISL